MSAENQTPVSGGPEPAAPAAAQASAPKLTAIQVIEQELGQFFQKREEAVAHLHAVEGAIQGAQYLLAKLKAAEAAAVAAVEEGVKGVEKVESEVVAGAKKVIEFVKKES